MESDSHETKVLSPKMSGNRRGEKGEISRHQREGLEIPRNGIHRKLRAAKKNLGEKKGVRVEDRYFEEPRKQFDPDDHRGEKG
jgi:hypothetical protein